MFWLKSKNVPINTPGIQKKTKRTQMRTYLGFLHFFFATQFQPGVDCFTMYAQQYVSIYAIRSQSQDLYLSQRNTEMLEILKV